MIHDITAVWLFKESDGNKSMDKPLLLLSFVPLPSVKANGKVNNPVHVFWECFKQVSFGVSNKRHDFPIIAHLILTLVSRNVFPNLFHKKGQFNLVPRSAG